MSDDMTPPENKLLKLIAGREFTFYSWVGTIFVAMKLGSPTEKGNLGEELLKLELADIGFQAEFHPSFSKKSVSRRGPWDVRCRRDGKELLFEVKVATQDVHKNHQFNGIRYDTKYTHLFLLGVLPNRLLYKIIAKRDLDQYKLVAMAKKTNSTFKLTLESTKLNKFNNFPSEIKRVFDSDAKKYRK